MSNAIPLLEGTDASGGYLVRDTYGETLQDAIQRLSPTLSLSRVDRVVGKRQRYTVYAGRPTAAFVAEGAAKGVTGAEFTELVVNIKKIATIVLYTEELLEDAVEDPRILVNADVEGAFADLIDAHILGWAAGSTVSTSFDAAVKATTSLVEYDQSKADGLPLALSSAMATIESNGGTVTGAVFNPDARQVLRDARQSGSGLGAAQSVFSDGFQREPDSLHGVQLNYSTNLPTLQGAAAAGRDVGIVGDWTHAVACLRRDITVRSSNQATVDVSGTLHNTFQQNKTAVLWEQRVGFNVHDINRMFVKIRNAS